MTCKKEDSTHIKLFQFYAWNKDRSRCFENFLLTDENTEAFKAAQQAAIQPGEVYNPLYIYGGTCTGKTYLLYAIEDFLHKHSPQLNVLHVTMEEFSNELINAIRERNDANLPDFRSKYRGADVLLVDDVQFLVGKESQEFLYTFNALYDAGKQIVITGNHDPETLKQEGLEERVAARLLFGRAVEIKRRPDTADGTEKPGMSPEITENLPCHCGSMNFSDEDEDDGLETTREMLRSGIQENRERKKFPNQVNYRQACRTYMDHPDVIVKLFYRGLSDELALLFREGTVEDIQEMRHGKLFVEGTDFVSKVYGTFLDGHIHYCHADVNGSRVYFLYDSREGVAAMYRAKTSPGSGRTWLCYGKYTPEDGKVTFISVAESPEKEKEIRNLLLGRFRDEAALLPERKNVAKPEATEGNTVPEEAAFRLISNHWSRILDKMRTDYGISDIPWRLWIRPLKPLEMRKRVLYIVCGMDIGTTMAERKYTDMLQDAVESMTGIQIDPVFLPPEVQETDSARMKYAVRLEGRSVVLPSPALEVLGTGAVVTKALDGDIALYPMAEWEEMKHRLLSFCAHGNGRKFVRFLLAGAEETTVSRSGVLVIPEHFEDLCRDIMETEIRDTGVILRPVE